MSDISKCNGKNCEKRNTCFRYLAKCTPWQFWGMFDDICSEENGYCFYENIQNN